MLKRDLHMHSCVTITVFPVQNTLCVNIGCHAWCLGVVKIIMPTFYYQHWTMLTKEKEGSWPDARQNHAACCLNFDQDFPQILVSGGVNNKLKKIHKDVWLLDVKTGTWKEVYMCMSVRNASCNNPIRHLYRHIFFIGQQVS